MIYATVNLTIGDYTSTCDKKILLYRGDRNVEIRFVMKGNKFTVLDSTYAQLIIKRPSATSVFSKPALIQNDTVILTITEDMIDELKEIGEYTFQIRLYDTDMNARATLPPCNSCLTIEKPIVIEESAVNLAVVNDSVVMIADTSTSEEDIFTEDNEYNRTTWVDGDLITDARLNKIEDALYYINQNCGGDTGATAPYISTELPETVLVGPGENFDLYLDFNSPNLGKGTLKVFINDVEAVSTKIDQGETTTSISGDFFVKGINRLVVYVLDSVGVMSNSLTFYARYGSTELTSDFDVSGSYVYGETVIYYFTPTALDTSLKLTFYMVIDGAVQQGVECTSDTRGYFTFPSNLTPGSHYCEAYVLDSNGVKSNTLTFNLIILAENSLTVTSDTKEVSVEEGEELVLDYQVHMNNNSSFITKTYIDGNLVNIGECGLGVNYYRTSSLTEGDHTIKIEVWDATETYSGYVLWNITITPSIFVMLQPVNAGAMFIASAVNRSNVDERRDEFIGKDQEGNEIVGELFNFSFDSDSGWVNDELIISGNSHVEIPIQPLSNNARYGFTLDIEFTSKQIGAEDAEVLTLWNDEKNCGIRITTENLILRSAEGNECNLYFTDNERTNVMFIIDRQERKAKIYLNGVMCEAFHLSDYSIDGVSYLEDFTVNSNVILGGYYKAGYAKIRNLRIYNVALTTSEIINNWISCEIVKSKQEELVEFQKGNDLPTLYVYCDFSGLGKDDEKPCRIVYNSTDEEKYGKSFNLAHKQSTCQYQGNSSMTYPIKNYRLNLRDENGDKWYYDFPDSQPECRFTLKADFMNSCHAHNTGMAKFINDNLYNYNLTDEKSMNPFKWHHIQNGGKINDFREAINGFPCRLILVNDGETPLNEGQNEPTPGNTKDMGIFNFNNDKDATTTLGFDSDIFPNCASYEVTANSDTSAGAFMSYSGGGDESEELDYIKQSFELRYPNKDDVPEGWGFMGVEEADSGIAEGTGLKALIDWVDGSTDEEFVAEFEEHFHKDYTLRYYALVVLIGAVDNLGRNMMLDTADNKIFFPRFYDIDTILSYDNSGNIAFDVDIEMEQGYWNTSNSRLWTRVRELMHDDIVAVYNNMRQNGVSYDKIMKYMYDEQIAKIPQTYYNKDYDVKYAPFEDSYIDMAHGNGYEHMKRWLKNRFIFCDTLFDYAPSYNNDILTIHANTTEPMTIYIETYTPVYQHMSWYNGQMDKKKIDGKIAVEFTGTAKAATDQEVLIYGGSNIKSIKGISSMNPNQMLIGSATRLIELDVSNSPLLKDINSNQANLSPHSYLTKLNISNCPLLGGNLRINNSSLIQEINASGTAISGVIVPSKMMNLLRVNFANCENLTSLDLSGWDTSKMTDMSGMFNGCSNLTSLDVSGWDTGNVTAMNSMFRGCSNLTSLDLSGFDTGNVTDMSGMFNGCSNLTSLDVSGFDVSNATNMASMFVGCSGLTSLDLSGWDTSNVTAMNSMFQNCSNLTSLDLNGFDTGNVTDMYATFTGCSNLTSLDLSGFDTSNVTNMGYMFSGCSGLTSLDVSGFDTGNATNMANMFYGCSGLTSLDVSEFATSNVTNMSYMFNGCTNLTSLDVSEFTTGNVTNMSGMFRGCSGLTSLDVSEFTTGNVTNMYATFTGCTNLTSLDLSGWNASNVTNMGYMFSGCSGLTSLDISGWDTSKVTDMSGIFNGCSNLNLINANNCAVDAITKISEQLPTRTEASPGNIRLTETTDDLSATLLSKYWKALIGLVVAIYTTTDETYIPTFNNGFTVSTRDVYSSSDGLYSVTLTASEDFSSCSFKDATTLISVEYLRGTDKVTNMASMFQGCSNLTSLDLSGFDTSKVTNMASMFQNCTSLTSLDLSGWDTSNVTSMNTMFNVCSSLTSLDLSDWNTSNVSDMFAIFTACSGLTSLDVSGWDTGKITSMTYMFAACSSLISLDLSGWDTSNVTNISYMFQDCTNLTSLDVSGWDTGNVHTIYDIFRGCSSLTSLDLSDWDTSNATNMANMFNGCSSLTSLEISGFATGKVTNMNSMFSGCSGLTSLDLSGWDTSNVTDMYATFAVCSGLTSLDLSGWNASNVTNMGYMFVGCSKLSQLDAPMNISTNLSISDTILDAASILDVINNLATITVAYTLTLNATLLAKITEEQIAIATNKGWSIA